MEREFIDLLDFQTVLKDRVHCAFPSKFWLRAEISALKMRPAGHCYLELSQSEGGTLVAKASAVVWAGRYRFIAPYFKSVTGEEVAPGMTVLLSVQVNYSELYGFSLIIDDIDPEYTLGQKEMERRKTIERLRSEGLMELQKQFSLPRVPWRFAVVSAENAAGYRDFMRHLHENVYGFSFCTDLYPALMQGASCPESIICALDGILESGIKYDAVLLLRGGGSKLDLACYDDYTLSAVIAQYPLPVFTAIGHDEDFHVCDMVANMYVKTPTALADALISLYEDEDSMLSSLSSRIRLAFGGRVSSAEASLTAVLSRVRLSFAGRAGAEDRRVDNLYGGVRTAFRSYILSSGNRVELLSSRMRNSFLVRLSGMESKVALLQTRILSSDPGAVLKRGYALAIADDGTALRKVVGVHEGATVGVMLADGVLRCRVEKVEIEEYGK